MMKSKKNEFSARQAKRLKKLLRRKKTSFLRDKQNALKNCFSLFLAATVVDL
jgi:hypothetical protein